MDVIIRQYEESYLESLNNLLTEVYNKTHKGITTDNNIELVALIENKVVGFLILTKLYDVLENNYYGYINYVCVKEEYRNQKIATKLLEKALVISRNENFSYLELTSNSSRKPAQHLYQKLGFVKRNTDVFRMKLSNK